MLTIQPAPTQKPIVSEVTLDPYLPCAHAQCSGVYLDPRHGSSFGIIINFFSVIVKKVLMTSKNEL